MSISLGVQNKIRFSFIRKKNMREAHIKSSCHSNRYLFSFLQLPFMWLGGCSALIRSRNGFNSLQESSISFESDSNMVFITGELMDRIILLAYTFWSSTIKVMSLWSQGLVKSISSCISGVTSILKQQSAIH